RSVEDVAAGRWALVDRERIGGDYLERRHDIRVLDRPARAVETIAHLTHVEGSAHEGEPSASLGEKMLGRHPAPRDRVGRDGAETSLGVHPIDEHDRDLPLAEPLEPPRDVAIGRDEHTPHLLLLEEVEVELLAGRVLV